MTWYGQIAYQLTGYIPEATYVDCGTIRLSRNTLYRHKVLVQQSGICYKYLVMPTVYSHKTNKLGMFLYMLETAPVFQLMHGVQEQLNNALHYLPTTNAQKSYTFKTLNELFFHNRFNVGLGQTSQSFQVLQKNTIRMHQPLRVFSPEFKLVAMAGMPHHIDTVVMLLWTNRQKRIGHNSSYHIGYTQHKLIPRLYVDQFVQCMHEMPVHAVNIAERVAEVEKLYQSGEVYENRIENYLMNKEAVQ